MNLSSIRREQNKAFSFARKMKKISLSAIRNEICRLAGTGASWNEAKAALRRLIARLPATRQANE
jgi:hypothetical protein